MRRILISICITFKKLRPVALAAGAMPGIALAQWSGAIEDPDVKEHSLGAVTVTAPTITAETEFSGSYTTGQTNAATGLPLSIRETPQSVTVVTRQRMDDQQLQTVRDVLGNSTGISANTLDYRTTFYSRGFSLDNFQFDRVPTTYVSGASYLDTAFYDRIEIVRGSTGLLTGAGNPSASVNLVRKRPTKEFQAAISVGAGSWDNYRATVDLSTPLTQDGRVRARIVGVYQDAHSFVDSYTDKKGAFYGALDADLTRQTTLGIGFDYQNITPNGIPWGGLPMFFSDGTRTNWPRSKTLSADWARFDTRLTTTFANIEHRFDTGWKLQAWITQGRTRESSELFNAEGYPNKSTGYLDKVTAMASNSRTLQTSYDLMASGPFSLFGRRHELVVGAMQSRRGSFGANTGHLGRARAMLSPISDFYDYNGKYPEPDFGAVGFNSTSDSTIKQSGMYFSSRFSITDPLTLIIGGRLSHYSYESYNTNTNYQKKLKAIPYVGIVYDINSIYSVYTSYTGIFNPQTQKDVSGNILAPTVGKTAEIGLKAEYFDGKLNASISVFDTRQDNVAQQEPNKRTPQGDTAYYGVDGTKSQGFDIDLQGEIRTGWNVFAGISHFTASDSTGNRLSSAIPRTTARVFTTYKLPGNLNKVTVGGGISWQSRFYQTTASPIGRLEVGQSPYALVSLMARYDITKSVTATININNLLDKQYYTMAGFYGQQLYGAPRNVFATLSYKM